MSTERVWTATEMELMSPDDRVRIVREGQLSSLDELDPEFRASSLGSMANLVPNAAPLASPRRPTSS
jgi:hypothetical protein